MQTTDYRNGKITTEKNGTFTASYWNTQATKPYMALAGQGYGFTSIEAAQAAIDAALSATPNPVDEHETDRWFAIHGVPSAKNVGRVMSKIASERVCRKCHTSSLDGANFTTDAESGICDDCY